MQKIILIIMLFITASIIYSQKPCPGIPTIIYAGKTYNTVQVGTQCWLKENINVGKRIDVSSEQTNNNKIEKYCYNDDPNNCATYGGLYQWAEAVQYQNGATNSPLPNPAFTGNVKGICPTGWHIPSLTEFQTLGTAVNNNGNSLISLRQGIGTNTSGFSALLAGGRDINSSFRYLESITYFWSSTEDGAGIAFGVGLNGSNRSVTLDGGYNRGYGFSVRCLKD
jgi:uncharacterized protein (TIGR02145 family)